MTRTIWVGAVAYDPTVVTIWEGMRRYFHEEAHLPVEVVLFQSYEAQVYALLAGSDDHAPHIDIGWNTNLAYLQADAWSSNRCRPIAMRDTDIGWATKIVAVSGGPVAKLTDLRNRTLALGSRDSGHAAILPVHFLEREGLVEQRDYRTLRFNSDVGKHGDTGTSEVDVVRAVLDGRADAGAIGSPFWEKVQSGHLVPAGALREVYAPGSSYLGSLPLRHRHRLQVDQRAELGPLLLIVTSSSSSVTSSILPLMSPARRTADNWACL
jgi:phosphonate transport system substrate-binding protein